MEGLLSKIVPGANHFTHKDLVTLLGADVEQRNRLYGLAAETKLLFRGKKTYYRGLIEFSNVCMKDCSYCGIRSSNELTERYSLSDEQILASARFAWENKYGSIVLQGGELSGAAFVKKIDQLVQSIKKMTNGELGITLSLGEQSKDTYQRWFDSGAHRYLLRIEASNPELYRKIHPDNSLHSYQERLEALINLKNVGYLTGTGVMIGLPFQTFDDLASDLLFMKELGIDMCGMGPYIEHMDTPLWAYKDILMPRIERFNLSLKMVAALRLMLPTINIAATTAMQAIDPMGREKALKVGANIIMPNITPTQVREHYKLYEDKPCMDEDAEQCHHCLEARVCLAGDEIGYGEWGDSRPVVAYCITN